MVIVYPNTPEQYSMDGYLDSNLGTAVRILPKDWDMISLVDGGEGSGKSVIAQQIAKRVDPTLNLSRIVFTPEDFRAAVVAAKKFEAVIYDEAYTGLSSRSAMSYVNRALVSMLAEIRQKNLFIVVVMPTFFDLDKYVALWRSRFLIHVYTAENFERGYFAFYNADKKKDLYVNGKKYYSYAMPRPNFTGRFPNHYTVDETEYKKKKLDSLKARETKAEETQIRQEVEAALFERIMQLDDKVTHAVKMQILDMPSSTYFRKLKQYSEMGGIS